MARQLSWSDVRGGVIAAVTLALAAFVVLRFSRVGALHGDTFPLIVQVGEARGLLVGSEVWLSGQKVGKVRSIRFRSPSVSDTSSRIELELTILEVHRTAIHRDAEAQIRNGGSIIGNPVVYLTPGTLRTAIIRSWDTVRARPQADLEGATGQFGSASREFPVIINNVKVLSAQLSGTGGTVGAFLNGPGAGELGRAKILASRLGTRFGGGGSAGLIMRGGLAARAQRVMSRVDSVRALLASPNTSFGRFRRDSTLLAEVGDIRDELALVRRQLDEPRGTAGRVLHDSALGNALAATQREMTLLFADMKQHPLRYVGF
ncbi:MAG: MCE family protein [Gemmatimonadaceae bacterium]|nr:MCE family protein [Gemmatimonadaceae bacterium]